MMKHLQPTLTSTRLKWPARGICLLLLLTAFGSSTALAAPANGSPSSPYSPETSSAEHRPLTGTEHQPNSQTTSASRDYAPPSFSLPAEFLPLDGIEVLPATQASPLIDPVLTGINNSVYYLPENYTKFSRQAKHTGALDGAIPNYNGIAQPNWRAEYALPYVQLKDSTSTLSTAIRGPPPYWLAQAAIRPVSGWPHQASSSPYSLYFQKLFTVRSTR